MKLPPLPDDAFDGEKQSVQVQFQKCPHKNIKIISSTEVRCECGVGWTGKDVHKLSDSNLKTSP
jgi:hypothetical protein